MKEIKITPIVTILDFKIGKHVNGIESLAGCELEVIKISPDYANISFQLKHIVQQRKAIAFGCIIKVEYDLRELSPNALPIETAEKLLKNAVIYSTNGLNQKIKEAGAVEAALPPTQNWIDDNMVRLKKAIASQN